MALIAALTGSVAPASANHYDHLLAPKKACPHQTDRSDSKRTQLRAMRCMHNYARDKRRKRPLRGLKSLKSSSQRKAVDILRCQEFSHTACGRDAFYWFRKVGFAKGCYTAGENISMGSGFKGTVRYTMSGWLHSDGHRGAVLKRSYRRFGISMVRGDLSGYRVQTWVTHFGSRC